MTNARKQLYISLAVILILLLLIVNGKARLGDARNTKARLTFSDSELSVSRNQNLTDASRRTGQGRAPSTVSLTDRSVEIEVINGHTGASVAKADIWCLPSALGLKETQYPNEADRWNELMSLPRQSQTDSQGVALLSACRQSETIVLAKCNGFFGMRTLVWRDTSGHIPASCRERILVYPDWDLLVEVTDAELRGLPSMSILLQ